MPDIVITGVGIISAAGTDPEQNIRTFRGNKSPMSRLSGFTSALAEEIPVCEIKMHNNDIAQICGLKKKQNYSRTALLGLYAGREALKQAELSSKTLENTVLISATTVGGMRRTEEYCRDQYQKKQSRLRDINRHDPGDSALVMADLLGTGNIATTINTACSSSLNSIILGARMIRQGLCEAALAGGTDCLCLFTLNGFNSLMILDKNGCRPFDSTRQGLTLGEGAGFVVLESEDHAAKRRKIPLCRLSGWGNTCDAHHMTASSPEGDGAVASMNEALAMSSLKPEQIDYINAHGTGTPNNDLSEGRALEKVFTKVPPVSSTKAVTGHTLGASGGIETVLCILSILNGHIYPNLRYTSPMAELSFKPALSMLSGQKIHHVLTNSFGFGGSNSTLVLSAI